MEIVKIVNSYFLENTYFIKYNNLNIIIDPGSDIDKILNNINIDKIDYVLLTHGHMDHIGSVKELINLYHPKVYLNYNDLDYIKGKIIIDPYFDKNKYDFDCLDYKEFNVAGIKILNTPGHSKGSVCLYFEKEKVLFSGDTLFKGSFGRYDFIGGNLNELKNSINLLFKLDEDVIIYPGHDEKTIIKEEKEKNIIKFY